MSLLRQLWLSVVVAMIVLLAGSLVVSVATARTYLQQQLLTQGANGAASLALSMSQLGTDAATAETLINAMFDSGYYRKIRYADINNKTLIERVSRDTGAGAPAWFVDLAPIEAVPGESLVSDGWRQAGAVVVEAHTRYAVASLWSGALRMGVMLLLAGLLWGAGITYLMKRIRRPLDDMADQAAAIGDGRFMTVSEPRVTELRSVARALNRMAERVRNMFADQAHRISTLRDEAARDPVSGLHNRGMFMGELRRLLTDENAPKQGALTLVRIEHLAELNQQLGHQKTDILLQEMGKRLTALIDPVEEGVVARLNGPDFALLLPGYALENAESVASRIAQLFSADDPLTPAAGLELCSAVTDFERGEPAGQVLARADNALMSAEGSGQLVSVSSGQMSEAHGEIAWRQTLEAALESQRFRLDYFPVLQLDGNLVHREAMLRLIDEKGEVQTAGRFMPAAMRVGLSAECDLMAIELALKEMRQSSDELAVNLSATSLLAGGFLSRLQRLLDENSQFAPRLSLEISERGLDTHLGGMEALADILSRHGSRLGLEHFGQKLSALPKLYALRLSYIKIDGVFVAGIDENAANQKLVEAIANAARSLDIAPYAEQVLNGGEWSCLEGLGVVGMTGPEATRRFGES